MPEEIKILGVAIYFQTSGELQEFYQNFTRFIAVRRWIKKIEEKLPIATEKKKSYCVG